MPGFTPEPNAIGNDWSRNAPGLGFIFGDQRDIRNFAMDHNWITTDSLLNVPYSNKYNDNLTLTATIEPIPDLRIELNATRTYSHMHQEYLNNTGTSTVNVPLSPLDNGTFTMSYIMIGTSFTKTSTDNTSTLFEKMKNDRLQIAQRYSARNPWSKGIVDSTGFPAGYGPNDQEVLTTAFLAAYSGRNPAKISLNTFPAIPLPNWRITYDGFMKIAWFKKLFRTFTLTHAYLSTYNVGSFTSNINYTESQGSPNAVNDAGNFIPKAQFSVISITEQYSPLIKIDMGWVNSLLSDFEWRKSRNLSFSFCQQPVDRNVHRRICCRTWLPL